jgi:LPXTG-motif cell wall-anchored protein
LSTGAKAAIGVVIPAVFLALMIGGYFFYRRKRKASAEEVAEMPGGFKDTPPTELNAVERKGELPGGVLKAIVQPRLHELP